MRELPEPGFYAGVHPAHYHGWKAASHSRLTTLDEKSPAHVRVPEPATDQTPGTKLSARDLGTAIHVATLEPERFEEWYALRPPGHANSNAYKAAAQRLLADAPFRTLLHPDDYDTTRHVAEAVRAHPFAGGLIRDAAPGRELSITWEDGLTGVRCKARIDVPVPGVGIADLKSTTDASPEAFGKQAFDMAWWRQGGMYLTGAGEVGIDVPANSLLIAAEKTEPWAVAVYRVPRKWLVQAELEVEQLLARWAECERSGEWPGFSPKYTELAMPYWAERRLKEAAVADQTSPVELVS